MGFETPEEGYLAKIVVPAGAKNVAIGQLVCIIVADEASVAAFKDFKDDGAVAAPPPSAPTAAAPPPPPPVSSSAPAPSVAATSPSMAASGDRVFASPLARRLAAEQGLSLSVRLLLDRCVKLHFTMRLNTPRRVSKAVDCIPRSHRKIFREHHQQVRDSWPVHQVLAWLEVVIFPSPVFVELSLNVYWRANRRYLTTTSPSRSEWTRHWR